jgi:phage terminase large subunit-like protein
MPRSAEEAFSQFTKEETILIKWIVSSRQMLRPKQLPPDEIPDWTMFGMMTGRGFGKTVAMANWLGQEAAKTPKSLNAVVAPTHQDVQTVCFEGPTGLLSVIPEELVDEYKRSEPITIKLWNGALIRGFAGDSPERLRGPQHHNAWCLTGDTSVAMADGSSIPLMSITCGMMIQTRHGPRRVLDQALTQRQAQLLELEVDGVPILRGTADHPVFVEGCGFLSLAQLKVGDRVCRISSTKAKSFGGTKTAITSPTLGNGCIDGSSRTAKVQFHIGGSCTMWTKIKRTTTRLISSLCRRAGILDYMPLAANSLSSKSAVPVGVYGSGGESENLTRNLSAPNAESHSCLGLLPRRVDSAVSDASRLLGRLLLLQKPGRASNAAALIPLLNVYSGTVLSGATRMRCTTEGLADHGLSNAERARTNFNQLAPMRDSVVESVPSTTDGVCTSVRQLGIREDVFNITVEGANEFFANGVLVHNCDELASFQYPEEALSNLQLGLRLGSRPRFGWSTTPRPRAFLSQLIAETAANGRVSYGSLFENRDNLPEKFIESIAKWDGTSLGRQELYGEIISLEELGIVRRSDWMLYPAKKPLPKFSFVLMSLDTALTEKTVDSKTHDPDFTACAVWGVFEHKGERCFMLLDCWQDRLGLPALIDRVRKERKFTYGEQDSPILPTTAFCRPVMYGNFGRPIDLIVIEQQGAGRPLIQMLAKEGIFAYEYNPGKADKLQRLHAISPLFVHRRVFAVESETTPGLCKRWADPLVTQVCSYCGKGSLPHDDLVDVTSQGLRYLMDNFVGPVTGPAQVRVANDVEVVTYGDNPYTA